MTKAQRKINMYLIAQAMQLPQTSIELNKKLNEAAKAGVQDAINKLD